MLDLEKKTGERNPRLLTRPKLRADLRRYQDIYNSLSSARGYNEVGLQPIKIEAVKAYADIALIPMGWGASKLLRIIQAMDAAHLEWWAKKKNKNK